MISSCPGAQKFRQPEPETMKCPNCAAEIEIWTDEVQAICPNCQQKVLRSQGQVCLDWCRYAKECIGDKTYAEYMQNKALIIKDKLLRNLEEYFGTDAKRINHAKKVMEYAEELLRQEGGDWHIVIPASILHDVGIKIAEEKYGSNAGHYQESEGPEIARRILLEIGLKKDDIEEICQIIAYHHSPGKVKTHNFQLLYEADWLVNLKDEAARDDKQRLAAVIEKVFVTKTGKEIAKQTYL